MIKWRYPVSLIIENTSKLSIMILDKETATRKLQRIALEIAERNHDQQELLLIGIKENGIHIARLLAAYLKSNFSGVIEIASLSMNKKKPDQISLSTTINLDDKNILLIDDVANSGSTLLYALKPLLGYHPAKIETVALVERTYKKFPVHIDYVGLSVATTREETIVVTVENGEVTGAELA